MSQSIHISLYSLYTLNIHHFICQIYLNKGGEKKLTEQLDRKISKDTEDLNNRINQLDLTDMHKILHQTTAGTH